MHAYYIFYFFIVIFFLFSQKILIEKKTKNFFYFLFIITIIIFTGLRNNIGGDWIIYNENYIANGEEFSFNKYNIRSDYGWELISYLSYKLGFSIHMLNFISSIFFFLCLHNFIKIYYSKLLVYIISFPIIIVILLMGYSRQAIAFAFLLLILSSLFKDRFLPAFIYLCIGIFFHKSLILFFLLFLIFPRKLIDKVFAKKIYFLSIIFLFFLLFLIFFIIKQDLYNLYLNYFGAAVNKNPIAQGAYQRWLINFIPALLFLIFYKKFNTNIIERRIILFFSLFSIFSIFFINYYTTGIDRYLYYFSLIQIYVFSSLPILFQKYKKIIETLIIIYYSSVLIIWFNFAHHKNAWIPYENLITSIF